MEEYQPGADAAKPTWRRVVDFPLVAMVIAVAIFIAAVALGTAIGKPLESMGQPMRSALRAVITLVLVFAAYKLLIRHLGERPRDDLPMGEAPKGLGIGLLFGFVLFSAVVGVAAIADVYNITGEGGTSEVVTALITIAIMPGVLEELLFRGILFRWLEEFAGSWVALLLTSALFGLGHIFNPNASMLSSAAIAIEAGVLLGGVYMLTRNLWVPIGLHAAWNFTQGQIWDVPVSGMDQNGLVQAQLSGPEILSGGGFGLEASLFAMVICTAVGVWLVMRAIRQGQLVQPLWVRRRALKDGAPPA